MPGPVTDRPTPFAGEGVDTDALAREARALADGTRLRLFKLLVDRTEPMDVAALTAEVGVHHSVVRDHLVQLEKAGLVESATRPTGRRGRPPRRYGPTAAAMERWGGGGGFRLLASVLAEALRLGLTPVEAGRRAGQRLVRAGAGDALDQVEAEAARLGFRPWRDEQAEGTDLVLQTCPLAAVAAEDPSAVCGIHLGLAQGIAAEAGGMVVSGLDAVDPEAGGCRFHFRPSA